MSPRPIRTPGKQSIKSNLYYSFITRSQAGSIDFTASDNPCTRTSGIFLCLLMRNCLPLYFNGSSDLCSCLFCPVMDNYCVLLLVPLLVFTKEKCPGLLRGRSVTGYNTSLVFREVPWHTYLTLQEYQTYQGIHRFHSNVSLLRLQIRCDRQ